MEPVKLAIAGCGLITEESHLPAVLRSPVVELVGLVDRNLERAEALARRHALRVAISATLAPMLQTAEAVLVATPNHVHAEVCRECLENGVAVLVEKPFTITYAEACDLNRLAREHGAMIAVGLATRTFPVVDLMKRRLSENFFGKISSFHFEFGSSGGWAPVSGYNLDPKLSGGGVLVVSGSHFIDRMLYWFGEPSAFEYFDDSHGGVEANSKACLEFPGGLRGTLFFSKTVGLKNRFVMESERYRVEMPLSETSRITLFPRDLPGTKMTIEDPSASFKADADPFRIQLEYFARAVREKSVPLVSGEEAALSVKLCEEFYRARKPLPEPWMWFAK
jgi:predicted dehydrogenase